MELDTVQVDDHPWCRRRCSRGAKNGMEAIVVPVNCRELSVRGVLFCSALYLLPGRGYEYDGGIWPELLDPLLFLRSTFSYRLDRDRAY
jgi:hypothetical protein